MSRMTQGVALAVICAASGAAQHMEGEDMHHEARWPSYERICAQLSAWASEHPDVMRLEELGCTAEGRPLLAAHITDPEADPAQKEHVLFTANHAGQERTAATGILMVMRWLLSDDALAQEVRRRQVVCCMPVGNPDGYERGGTTRNTHGLSPCNDWTLEGPKDPANHPEAVAVQQLIDRYQPEVHSDFHGLDLSFPGYIAVENSGASYGNYALRPYHPRIMREMDAAAEAEGFPSDRGEIDAERLFYGEPYAAISEKFWLGRAQVFAGTYAYVHYHTLPLHSEVYWERSGLLKHKRLLEMGHETWPGEIYPGYPTRVALWSNFDLLTAYGETAAQRRASRVELWSKQSQISLGFINPEVEGIKFVICATTPQARQRWLADTSTKAFAQRLRDDPGPLEAAPILDCLGNRPEGPGQWGAQPNIAFDKPAPRIDPAPPIEHGLSLRLRLAYPDAKIEDLRLNGEPIQESHTDGCVVYTARAFTHIQVNIPPERTKREDFFVVTCRYDPGVKRTQGVW